MYGPNLQSADDVLYWSYSKEEKAMFFPPAPRVWANAR